MKNRGARKGNQRDASRRWPCASPEPIAQSAAWPPLLAACLALMTEPKNLFRLSTSDFLWVSVLCGTVLLLAIAWAIFLRKRVNEQTGILLDRLQRIVALEEQYRELFENANDMVFTCGLKGHFTTLNQAGERITEYPRTKIIGINLRDLVVPEHAARAGRIIVSEDEGEESGTQEVEILTRRGRRVPLEIRTRRIYSEGRAVGIQGIARDITERKQADRERSLLAGIVESSDDAIVGETLDGTMVSWNQGAEKLYGYSAEEAIGQPISMLMPPENAAELQSLVAKLARGEHIAHYETVRQRKDGQVFPVSTSIFAIRNAHGQVTGAAAVTRDITERKRAEELFSKAFNASPEPVTISSLSNGIYIDVNQAFLRTTGYARDEVIGRSVSELRFWANPTARAGLLEELKKGPARDYEITFCTKSGELRTGLISAETIEVNGRRCLLAITKDVTEHRRAEETLARERNLLRTLIDTLPDFVYAKDKESRFLLANRPVALAMGAVSPEELIGKTDLDFYPLEMAEEFLADERQVLATGRALLNKDEPGRALDGSPAAILTSKVPFRDASGEIVGIVGVGRNITERKAVEEVLREYEKVVESAQDMMVVVDQEYRYRMANRSFLTYRGLDRRQIVGMMVAEVVGAEVFEEHIKKNLDECFEGKVVQYETRYPYPQLGERDLALAFYPIAGPAGIDRAACILQDITERKRATEALRRSEQQLAQAMDLACQAHWELDVASGMFTFNDRFYALYGTTAEREGGYQMSAETYAREFLPPEDAHLVTDAAAMPSDALDAQAAPALDHRIRRRDGEIRHILVRASVVKDSQGQIIKVRGVNQDITERKRAEEEARKSHRFLEGLLYSIPTRVFWKDLSLKYLGCNVLFAQDAGLDKPEDIIGKDDHQLAWRNQADSYRQDDLKVIQSGVPKLLIEEPQTTPDGRTIHLLTSKIPLRDSAGNIVGVLGVYEDISERKRMEENLRRSEERLRLAVEATDQTIWDWDLERNEVAWSGYDLEAHLGLARGEFGRHHEAFQAAVHPEDRDFVGQIVNRALAEGSEYNLEFRLVKADGSLCWMAARGTVIHDASGKAIRMIGVARDTTERKRAEEALLLKTAILEAESETSIDGILAVDDAGKIILWNKQFVRMWNVPEEFLESRDDAKVLERAVSGLDDQHREERSRDEVRFRDGRIIERYSSPLKNAQGQYYGRIWYFRDLTERKRAEEEIVKAKESAEVANRAKSEFLANMSHEIRTPMNGIIGMTELALDTQLTAEQRDYLGMVKDSADSLLTLINDILDFSKIEAGKFSLDVTPFELRDHLANTLKSLAPHAHQKGLEMVYAVAPDVPARLVGDPSRLRQILINLLGNSIKFTERGEISLRVEVESRREDSALLHFSVTDTGIGIPREKQQSIFDVFSQADSSTTRKYGGTGLGLSICTHLVGMMGGRLWVESEVGRGSTFHFTVRFGLQKETAPAAPEAEAATVELQDMPVLVVDDNATNRRILEAMLRHWKMQPELAQHGAEGLRLMGERKQDGHPFPLVLIDALMPGMDGFELAARIKADPGLAGATIMMLTSAGQRGDAARCRELGIEAYLIKPIRQSELLDAILTTLGKTARGKHRPSLVTRHSLREARRKLHILVVEDNAVNQQLAARLLEKQGHSVTLASNGRRALEKLGVEHPDLVEVADSLGREPPFDLVLMDVQMPEMDGLEATELIRRQEQETGKHLPIVAMTAHAMKGDRERCLAAGMDAYVSKPLHAEQLYAVLQETVAEHPDLRGVAEYPDSLAVEHPENTALLARVEGDTQLLGEMAGLFLKNYPRLLEEIRRAVEQRDARALERAAHTLKGSVSNFTARRAFQAARRLERLARQGGPAAQNDWKQVQSTCQELAESLLQLRPVLESYLKGVES
jgi:two-component system sensor histidine kinase/response regulator